MGAIADAMPDAMKSHRYIDFKDVAAAIEQSLDSLVPDLLPGGKRVGKNWVVRNPTREDKNASLSVNLETGAWLDFATQDRGKTFLSLILQITGEDYKDANYRLADELGVNPSLGSTSTTGNIRPQQARKPPAIVTASPETFKQQPSNLPPRTPKQEDGQPRFTVAGNDGPRPHDDEKRRHFYCRGGVPIRIKIMRKGDRKPYNLYRVIDADGQIGWQNREPVGFLKVPFIACANVFEGDTSLPLYWPEGERDTETVAKLGLPAFTFGGAGDGLPKGCEIYVAGRHLVILADNDDAGRKHAEEKAELSRGAAASIRITNFPELDKGGDVSDWIAAGHSCEDLIARVAASEHWPPKPKNEPREDQPSSAEQSADKTSGEAEDHAEEHLGRRAEQKDKLPPGYSFSDRGLMYQNPDDLDKPAMLIAGHFDVVAETRDADGASWGVLLHWMDHDDRPHQLALPRATLAGDGADARRILMDQGFYIAPSQTARGLFNSFLLQVRSTKRARATQRVGWHGNSFVMPDDCYGVDERDQLLLQSVTAHEHSFRQAGTLEEWQQNVARYAIGNSRLALAISAAFAGPLVGPCSAEGGGLHFKGASSTGKSTALHVAGSVWGGGDANGYVRSWRATANGLEGVALGHSDTLLCLDELSQLAAKEAGEAAYMLANGSGKSRSSRDGSARKAAKWRVLFLSSGEIGLADKVAEDGRGRKLAAGQQVRIVDIAADAGAGMGMFETLHGFESAEIFARHLRHATAQNYGVAARQYLGAIVPVIEDLRRQIAPIMKAFSQQFVPVGADGQIERVAQRFALVAVGGELAQQHGILPWQPGEAIAAAGRCFTDWIKLRGGITSGEERDGIEQVRAFLLANGMARFVPSWEEDSDRRNPVRDVAGYRRHVGDGWDFYVTPSAWKEICAGLDPRRTASMMHRKGYLGDADGSNLAKVTRIPGMGQQRVYQVSAHFLEGNEHD